ncbi:MAG: multidrug resistance efflux transporter family protein [Candidatus Limivivens sp.]|nr:multidrug resistance efflux transporter family protein [Candidatus Limivivens sp.]
MKKAFTCGILASLFFAFTFLLNSSMNLSGGFWMWSACLRYLIVLPMLALLLWRLPGDRFTPVLNDIKKQPVTWFLWSTVGFGFFYLPMTLGSAFGESWLVAASWQITIVAGVLLTPLFGKKIPIRNLLMAFVIVAGVFLLQISNMTANDFRGNFLAIFPILIGAFCYPLGNRKMMQHCPETMDTLQRVFGMVLCSTPFWILVAVTAFVCDGAPGMGQVVQSAGVALFSGVIATLLFFHATDLVKENPKQLAIVEATQSGEVVFTLLGGILVLGEKAPGIGGILGLVLIIGGMLCNSLISSK